MYNIDPYLSLLKKKMPHGDGKTEFTEDLLASLVGVGDSLPRLTGFSVTSEDDLYGLAFHYEIKNPAQTKDIFLHLKSTDLPVKDLPENLSFFCSKSNLAAHFNLLNLATVIILAAACVYSMLVLGVITLSLWSVLQLSSAYLNAQLSETVEQMKEELDNGQFNELNNKYHSKTVQFALYYANFLFLNVKSETKAFLWYCEGRVCQEMKTLDAALTYYEKASPLAQGEGLCFAIAKHRHQIYEYHRKQDKMDEIIENLPLDSSTFTYEEQTFFDHIKQVEQLILENSMQAAYDRFNQIPEPHRFEEKLFPLLMIRYYQVQASLVLVGGSILLDHIDECDRLPQAIQILESALKILEQQGLDDDDDVLLAIRGDHNALKALSPS